MDTSSLISTFMGKAKSISKHENDAIYQKAMLYEMMNSMNSLETQENDLRAFKKYIEEQLERIHNEKIADAQEVMMYLTSVLRGESLSEIVVVEGTGDGCSDARRMMKLPDERERLKAAELIGKRYGMFTDKVNVEGAIPVVIIDDLDDENDLDDEFDD